ncbi:HAD family hydrolase [Actinomadura rayongensis]|nr:HAD family hydrolase [Actinomadura rayongensis]
MQELAQVRAVAIDYGGTITDSSQPIDPKLRMRPVLPLAVAAFHQLAEMGYALVLASNTRPDQDRIKALEQAGVLHLFREDSVLESAKLGIAKPSPAFFDRVLDAAGNLEPEHVLMVGNNREHDIAPATAKGMIAALIERPDGLIPPPLPPRAFRLVAFAALPPVLRAARQYRGR